MKLGFVGTGQITKAVIYGILNSKIKYSKIYISNRNKKISSHLSKISKKIINNGYMTLTSTKNVEVINITTPTIRVLVAPAPTKAKTISKVEIGAAKIS